MYRYKVNIVKVVDGDTVDVDIDLGFGMVYKKQRVRMLGIDTPESRTRDLVEKKFGKASKKHLKTILEEAESIELVSHDKGKFGRILGDLFIGSNETSVNQQMILDHHAVAYTGGNKEETEAAHMANREVLLEQGVVVLETQSELEL
jgi:micrococcal nuclease|tara:strand:+ start:742 stop:1182 length:441 start_codon:yes stop_codon:yes gene_type:complete